MRRRKSVVLVVDGVGGFFSGRLLGLGGVSFGGEEGRCFNSMASPVYTLVGV